MVIDPDRLDASIENPTPSSMSKSTLLDPVVAIKRCA
jgi:hypothetical protein